jgi:hypothetical protein
MMSSALNMLSVWLRQFGWKGPHQFFVRSLFHGKHLQLEHAGLSHHNQTIQQIILHMELQKLHQGRLETETQHQGRGKHVVVDDQITTAVLEDAQIISTDLTHLQIIPVDSRTHPTTVATGLTDKEVIFADAFSLGEDADFLDVTILADVVTVETITEADTTSDAQIIQTIQIRTMN